MRGWAMLAALQLLVYLPASDQPMVTLVHATLAGLTGRIAPRSQLPSPPTLPDPGIRGCSETVGDGDCATYRATAAGLVDLYARLPRALAAGTGVVLSADGLILTNAHVIEGGRAFAAHDLGNHRNYTAQLVARDPIHDVALVRLNGATDLPVARLGNSDAVQVGEQVAAIGNAGGRGGATINTGTITALERAITSRDADSGHLEHLRGMFQTNARIEEGDSGGPLVDSAGYVIGIDTASTNTTGYAIPLATALAYAHVKPSGESDPSLLTQLTSQLGLSPAASRTH